MSRVRELEKRRAAALAVCATVPREEVRELLDMLGLIPLEPPEYRGTPWFDTGYDGGRVAHQSAQLRRLRSTRAPT